MGWIFCLGMLIGYTFNGDSIWLFTAGLFAISGGLSEVGSAIRNIFISEAEFDSVDEE